MRNVFQSTTDRRENVRSAPESLQSVTDRRDRASIGDGKSSPSLIDDEKFGATLVAASTANSRDGDGKWQWLRGSYGSVYLARTRIPNSRLLPLIAIKSAVFLKSSSLQKEREILLEILRGCPEIICCYGHQVTIENGQLLYNLLLEFAPGGTLADLIKNKNCGGMLPESDVRRYTHMILKGLSYMHEKGYVHCDIKPSNILVFPADHQEQDGVNRLKIADFGRAKRSGAGDFYVDGRLRNFRGTALYSSPESVACGLHEAPMDIWSLGCVIVEMVTGKPAWSYRDMHHLLCGIGFGGDDDLPKIPEGMSTNGKDFVIRCLVREPNERWTAKMLLNHPFILDITPN
ncbi:hypothetical protein F0562_011391 [Nyssa sinensis]|uniref:Protein kinase domain-containing protein n=1 Tax=Nyssa sinensis TaxID=561372 RepID=A0A5J5A6B7_9ASTE|nr:hypothetical protein F0562_011391 [Nyssa sinensis]